MAMVGCAEMSMTLQTSETEAQYKAVGPPNTRGGMLNARQSSTIPACSDYCFIALQLMQRL